MKIITLWLIRIYLIITFPLVFIHGFLIKPFKQTVELFLDCWEGPH